MHPLRSLHGPLLALSVIFAGTALAQGGGETDKSIAAAREGRKLYDEGAWQAALERFQLAEGMAHSPVLVLYLARCHRNLGDLVAAKRLFQQLASEPLAASATPPLVAAKAEAETELAAVTARIPRLSARVATTREQASLFVDDTPTASGAVLELNPGEHLIEVRVDGVVRAKRVVKLGEGEPLLDVELSLEPSTSKPPLPLRVQPPPRQEAEGSLLPGAIVLSIGGAGLLVGAITGGLALAKSNEVKSRCDGTICDPADAPIRDDVDTLATASTVSLIAGGAIAGTGIILLIVRPGGGPATPRVSVRPGLGWLSVEGLF